MIDLIETRKDELIALCRRHGVHTLELFGSATGDRFNPETSDLDFLVEFGDGSPDRYFNAYFGLIHDLEDLFGRDVDLVETKAIRNPYFLKSIARNRTVLYAA